MFPGPLYGTISVVRARDAAEEGPRNGSFTIRRTGNVGNPVTVNVTYAGTAQYLADYTVSGPGVSGNTVTMLANQSRVKVTVVPVDDNLVEGAEIIHVSVDAPGYHPVHATGLVQIEDNEPTVSIVATDRRATEPAENPATDKGRFKVSRTGSTGQALTVSYNVTGTATPGGDYVTLPGSVVIPAGEVEVEFDVDPLADANLEENSETVIVSLSPQPHYSIHPLFAADTVTIHANAVVVSATVPRVSEHTAPQTSAFTFERLGSTAVPLTVSYAVGGTASPDDYSAPALTGSVTFGVGVASVSVPVTVIDDSKSEGNEDIRVTLLPAPDNSYTLARPAAAKITIVDTVVSISANPASISEAGQIGTFTVTRQGDVDLPLTVTFRLTGEAESGDDYAPVPHQATIPAGQPAATFDIVPVDDQAPERPEDVVATLQDNPARYEVSSTGRSATVEILDNDVFIPPWDVEVVRRAWDPLDGRDLEQTGNLHLSHLLVLDQSPGTGQALDPSLVYNSDSVNVRPSFQVEIPSDFSRPLPPQIQVQLVFDAGGPNEQSATRTFDTAGFQQGRLLIAGIQTLNPVTVTGRYRWVIRVTMDFPEPDADIVAERSGSTFVVSNDASPYGPGWSLSMIDRLIDVPAAGAVNVFVPALNKNVLFDAEPGGKLRLFGTGGSRFYALVGGSFTSPEGDTGKLAALPAPPPAPFPADAAFSYTNPEKQTWLFDADGLQIAWYNTDDREFTTYEYTDGDGEADDLDTARAIDGFTADFDYANNRLSSVQGADTHVYGLVHQAGDLKQIDNPDGGHRAFTYDANHHLTFDALDTFHQGWQYGQHGGVITYTLGNDPPSTVQPAFSRGLTFAGWPAAPLLWSGKVTAVVADPRGYQTRWVLDEQGRELSMVDAAGGLWRWQRAHTTRRVTAASDPFNRTTFYTLDAQGYVTHEVFPDGTGRFYEYHPLHHALTRLIDERGKTTNFTYDGLGHLLTTENALHQFTVYTYEPTTGLVQSVEDARQNKWRQFMIDIGMSIMN